MNNILNIQDSRPKGSHCDFKSDHGLESHGLNKPSSSLLELAKRSRSIEEIVFRGERMITKFGAIAVNTGNQTARSPNDKYIVRESENKRRTSGGENTTDL